MNPNEMPPHVQVLQMVMGYWAAQVGATIARLGVVDTIQGAPRAEADIAHAVGAHPESLARLLRAAAMLGLLRETSPGHFTTTATGDCLRKDAPISLRDFFIAELAPGHWLPWGRLHDAVKEGRSVAADALGCDVWTYYQRNAEEGACFARAMSNISNVVVGEVLPAYDFARFSRIVDVGGSQGALLAGVLRANPAARGVLFDRADVIASGQAAVAAYGFGPRLEAVAGDFFESAPADGDLYLLKSILHDWDDAHCAKILRTVAAAAKPGATLCVVEMIVPPAGTPSPVHLMDLNMLVMLDGRERTAEQFRTLLATGGWTLSRVVPTRGLFCVIEAVRA